MTRSRAANLFLVTLLASLMVQPGTVRAQAALAPTANADSAAAPADAIAAFRRILATRYATPLSAESLAQARTMDDLLHLVRIDPFTDVYTPAQWRQMSVALGEAFGGIGAVLGSIRDTVVLGDVLPDGPAAGAGLRPRDRIVAIDDSSVTGWTVSHAVSHIRGRPGTPVVLGVVRAGHPVAQILVTRATVQHPSISAVSLDSSGLGIIAVDQFGSNLTGQLAQTIHAMQQHGLRTLIIDLRRNPGGLLDEAIGVANLFLPQGSLLVETRYRGREPDRHIAEQPTQFPSLPLALLVGPESASASEIVAGALQDAHRAVIVGRQTYGKGLVQTAAPLADGWMAKFTVGRWYTPGGRLIDRGIHASVDTTKPFDPGAPHSGGIQPELVAADSISDAARTAYQLLEKAGPGVFLALDDEVGRLIEAHPELTPSTEPIPGSAAHIFEAAGSAVDSLGQATRLALTPWLDAAVTRRAIAARFGYGASLVWQNDRDPQIAAATTALQVAKLTTSQRQ
jgi:carboxyl-terminal processing protease